MAGREGRGQSERQDGGHSHGSEETSLQEAVQSNQTQRHFAISLHHNDDGEHLTSIVCIRLSCPVFL